MVISNDSLEKLLPLLRPYLRDENERRAYLIRALGMDTPVLNRLVLNTPVDSFITNLVTELVSLGKISTGKLALCALLEVIRKDMGLDNQAKVEQLLQQLRNDLTTETSIATMPSPKRDQVFISYSHKDKVWLEKLQTMLKPLIRSNKISLWDDTQIKPGAKWKNEITQALAAAKVAVLMVSDNFLASDFIAEQELPPLLNAAKQEGLTIIWVYLSACLYEESEIGDYQAAHDTAEPLDTLPPGAQNQLLRTICQAIKAAATETSANP